MDDILCSILDYLKIKNTDFSVLITGKWGCGKTYYWNTVLSRAISDISTAGKPYKPIYISLFGLKSIEDINKRILFQYLGTSLGSKGVNIATGALIKLLSAGTTKLFGFDILKDLISYTDIVDNIELSQCILCLDDFERWGEDYKILMGFLTYLNEHKNIKTIIIANEDEIKSAEYNSYKDKLIRFSYRYTIINKKDLVNNILKTFNGKNPSSLMQYRDNIINLFIVSETDNIRFLMNAVQNTESLLTHIQKQLKVKSVILINAVSFCFAYSLEHAILNKKESFNEIDTNFSFLIRMHDEKNSGQLNKYFVFYNKYFGKTGLAFNYFRSIVNFIDTGIFNKADFIRDLNQYKVIFQQKQYAIFSLLHNGYWDLEDSDLKINCNKMIRYATSGKYKFNFYLEIYGLLIHLIKNNIYKYKLELLEKHFKNGMKRSFKEVKITDNIRIGENQYAKYSEVQVMRNLYKEYEKKQKELYSIQATKYLLEVLRKNVTEFDELLVNRYLRTDRCDFNYFEVPIFEYIKTSTMASIVKKMSNKELLIFRNAIKTRYDSRCYGEKEKSNIILLSEKLKLYKVPQKNPLRHYNLNLLITTLEDIISKYDNNT